MADFNKVILGLDISTTCTGVSIVSYDGENTKVLFIDRIKFKIPSKIKGTEALFLKSAQFKDCFLTKFKESNITDIVIEEPLPGSQNIETVCTLLKFNGMLSQSIYEALGIVPHYISSYDARKYAFPELMAVRKFNKKGEIYPLAKIRHALKHNELVLFGSYPWDCAKKLILWNKVSELYPDIKWVYDNKGELKTENFDASDSLVCVLGFINKCKYRNVEPSIKEWKEENSNIGGETKTIFQYTTTFCNSDFQKTIQV